MDVKYYNISEVAEILLPFAPGVCDKKEKGKKKLENYLYTRAGRSIEAKIDVDELSGRRSYSIPETEIERLKEEFKNKKKN